MKNLKIHRIFIFVLLLFAFYSTKAQNQIAGYVYDQVSRQGVGGANIFIQGTKKGTSTNANGYFLLIGLQNEMDSIFISHIAYHDTLIGIDFNETKRISIFLEPDSVKISSFVVTANRSETNMEDIPQRIDIINPDAIESYPATNSDDLLKMIPGVVVNRSWGIFSRNAAVNMRGMPGSERSLILLDGVPMNKSAGGTVNWHLISPEEIEKVEVVKGPGSALYGMNAMGGVINIITKNADKKPGVSASLGYGSLNTIKGQYNFYSNNFKESKGLYWKLGSFYRQGDGYILEPESLVTENSTEAYLQEGNAAALVGYQFGQNQNIELDYRFYKDKRGSGIKVAEKDGSFESFVNNNLRLGYNRFLGRTKLSLNAFYLNEFYERQSENVNTSNEYKLTDTRTDKKDLGIWLTLTRTLNRTHKITSGIDLKNGTLDNEEIYRTSTDELYTNGQLIFSGLFLQDEMNFAKDKLKLNAGLRLDYAYFFDGFLTVRNPTKNTGFLGDADLAFPESSWMQLSPKLAAKYLIIESVSIFGSFSTGFMPPKLDDLVGSKKIRRGFKIANPDLTPEVINSIEVGIDWSFRDKIFIKPSAFYSIGNDFQYMVATGDFLDEESSEPIAIYQKQNVSKVEVAGVELGTEYLINKQIKITANYTYNYSQILDYSSPDGLDLTGLVLNEVPENLIYTGIDWKNKFLDFHIDYAFTDDQWFDEENTEIVEGYSLLNMRISKKVIKNFHVILDVQDLLDTGFIDRKGYLSPGRFIMFEIKYLLK